MNKLIALEATHYYPFGLTMAGISSKALQFGNPENKYKYNGIEFDQDLGLDGYEAFFRNLDPQTGRWWQVDPETEDQEMWSPYTSNNDNPILYKDPRGNEGEECCIGIWDAIKKSYGEAKALAAGAVNAWSSDQVLGQEIRLRKKLVLREMRLPFTMLDRRQDMV